MNKKALFIAGGVIILSLALIIVSVILLTKDKKPKFNMTDFESESDISDSADKKESGGKSGKGESSGKNVGSKTISSSIEYSGGKSSNNGSSADGSSNKSAFEKGGSKNNSSKKNSSNKSSHNNKDSSQAEYYDIDWLEENPEHVHSYSGGWSSSKSGHWHECTTCGYRNDEADHIYSGDDKTCNICGYERELAKGTIKYKINSSGYDYTATVESHSDTEASAIKAKVYAEKNTEDLYQIKGKKYYMKKSMPLESMPKNLKSGDAVLFERGGIWRVPYKGSITLPNGVIMGAYGKGDKPKFYGSRRNFADNSLWEKVGNNLYRTYLKSSGNVGNMVFNDVACLGVKKWNLTDVKSNYDFFYDTDENLYFYYEGDIEKDFDSVELSQRGELIVFNSNCIIDNICVKYTGSHGIDGVHGTENVKITNCEVGFIGGSMQSGTTRFGNGIEFPIGAKNITVKHNHIYQCYDAGITFQSWSSANVATHYYDIDFSENLIENCCYGIEYFTTDGQKGTNKYSDYKNISIRANVIRFAGYEWSQLQRPDPWMTSLIRGGQWAYVKDCENFTITDNIFDISRASMIFWWWNDPAGGYHHDQPHNGLTVKNNTFYQAKTPDSRLMTYRNKNAIYGSDYTAFRKAVEKFDSNPKKTVWLDDLVLK